MKFRSELEVKKMPWPINYANKLLLIGSCFTENMGEKLRQQKFTVQENPHGILFNPVSVCHALQDYINQKVYTSQDLFQLNETFHSWHHHSRFSDLQEAGALEKINTSIVNTHQYLQQANYLFITLGSAWTYQLTEMAANAVVGSVAANNHKAPSSWFNRTLLKADETTHLLQQTIEALVNFTPGLKIIFTISPVRHLREGFIDNNRSKAVLIQAVHDVVSLNANCYYFPAYELVMDDLRDYRFYAEDLAHPNYQATQYVWEKFIGACIAPEAQKNMETIQQINLAFQHKPFNAASAQHQQFLKTFFSKTQALQQQYPQLNFTNELFYFEKGYKK